MQPCTNPLLHVKITKIFYINCYALIIDGNLNPTVNNVFLIIFLSAKDLPKISFGFFTTTRKVLATLFQTSIMNKSIE
jgi:hypothetical protein